MAQSTVTRRTILMSTVAAGAAILGIRPAYAADTVSGDLLFDLAKQYSRFNPHRTGTPTGITGTDWFAYQLHVRGATVGRWAYPYAHYDWAAEVRVGGQPVDAIPLYYEGVGHVDTDAPLIRPVVVNQGTDDTDVEAAMAEAHGTGAPLAVLPTVNRVNGASDYDGLVAANRDPAAGTTGIPTLLIPGHLANQARQDGVRAWIRARTRPAAAHDVTGWFGQPVTDPIVVTTPLSGWFGCAAERGTGVAVALELAAALATTHPVFVLGTTGHELNNAGLGAYLADAFDLTPRAVIHLGASIAAGSVDANGVATFAPWRVVTSNRQYAKVPGLRPALTAGSFTTIPTFAGEGALWYARLGDATPLLSFAGWFPQFHTPDDSATLTTSPDLLAQAYQSVNAAVAALLA